MALPAVGVAVVVAAMGLPNSHMSGEARNVAPAPRMAATHWSNQGFSRPMIRGVDVSRWDHIGPYSLSFRKMRKGGARFVFIKASDGIPKYDSEAAHWWSVDKPEAKAAGLIVGGYQYAVPTSDVTQITADATWKATVAARRVGRIRRGELPLVLDLEEAPRSLTKEQITSWALTWLRTARRITRKAPILYTYTNFARTRLVPQAGLGEFRFWQADWGQGRAVPPQVAGMQPASFWQFSSDGAIRGAGATRTDLNVFMGPRRQFLALAGVPWKKRGKYGF